MDKYQADLDRLTSTLKQIELYNEEMKSEIAVTRRWVQGCLMQRSPHQGICQNFVGSQGWGGTLVPALAVHVTGSLHLRRV